MTIHSLALPYCTIGFILILQKSYRSPGLPALASNIFHTGLILLQDYSIFLKLQTKNPTTNKTVNISFEFAKKIIFTFQNKFNSDYKNQKSYIKS